MEQIKALFDIEDYVCTINSGHREINCYGPFARTGSPINGADKHFETILKPKQLKREFDSATLAHTYKNYPQWLKTYVLSRSFKMTTNTVSVE